MLVRSSQWNKPVVGLVARVGIFTDEKDDTLVASVNGTNQTVTIMKFLIFLLNIPFFLIPHSYENIVHLGREKRNSFQAILSALWNTKCFVINNKYLNNSTFVNDKEMNYWYKKFKKIVLFQTDNSWVKSLDVGHICIFYRNNLRIFFLEES